MCFRQFLSMLTYDWKPRIDGLKPELLKLSDLPGEMNHPTVEYGFGFHAAFECCAGFGDQLVQDFFPWAKVKPWTRVSGSKDLTFFDQVIPSQPMGRLYDDMCRCWLWDADPPLLPQIEPAFYARRFGELIECEGVVEFIPRGQLNEHDPIHSQIIAKLGPGPSLGPGQIKGQARPPRVPFFVIEGILRRRAGKRAPSHHDMPPRHKQMVTRFFDDNNGPVTLWDSDALWLIAYYCFAIQPGGEDLDGLLRPTLEEARKWWQDNNHSSGR
jgi:hypothetical protein